jgi:starch synthase
MGFMRIVQVTTEFAPLAKAGGLGEVLVGLSRELVRQGGEVEVILPKYNFISPRLLTHLKHEVDFTAPEWEHQIANTMWSAVAENCSLHLLEMRHPKDYFHRAAIYGFEDDVPRFIYFARAVLEYLKVKGEPIDILHLHDWHAAALAPLLREIHREIQVKAIVLTIHNLEYQGQCSVHDLAAIGLKKGHIAHLQTSSHYNLLKGAVHYADAITAVSPTYAAEILTHEHGFGLDEDLRKQKGKLSGILNGIDLELWNPSNDPALTAHYSAGQPIAQIIAAKKENRKGLNLKPNAFWFGAVTRLVPQKGPKLLEAALKETIRQNGVFFLLGSSPIPEIQSHFEELKKQYSNNPNVFLHLDYDEALAHRLYAALDFLVVPSLFEPCGLTQLIAMHYGTVPIVRSTGGLKDTVFDCDDVHIPTGKHNGFTFFRPKPEALIETLRRATLRRQNSPTSHQVLMQHGMESDFSWKKPAKEYMAVYQQVSEGIAKLTEGKNFSGPF